MSSSVRLAVGLLVVGGKLDVVELIVRGRLELICFEMVRFRLVCLERRVATEEKLL